MNRLFFIGITAGFMLLQAAPSCAQQVEERRNAKVEKLPQTELRYTWEDEQWKKKREQKYLYNEDYNIYEKYYYYYSNEKLSDCFHYTMDFNEDGTVKRETQQWKYGDEETWYNFLYFDYFYDDVVPSFRTQKDVYIWNAGSQEWLYDDSGSNKSFFMDMERDASKRILQIQKWESPDKNLPYEGFYFEYADGSDGAVRMTMKNRNGSNMLVDAFLYDNIVWEKTNCQYLKFSKDIYSPFDGDENNKIKSFSLYSFDEDGNKTFMADVSFERNAEGKEKQVVINYADGTNAMIMNVYNILTNGNYDHYFFYWKDKDGNKTFDMGEEINLEEAKKTSFEYDQYGNEMCQEVFLYDSKTGGLTKSDSKISRAPQYLEDGTLKEFVYTYIMQGTVISKEKFVYDDFIEAENTGIKGVESNAALLQVRDGYVAAPDGVNYTVTDIEGRLCRSGVVSGSAISISDMPAGIYVVRAGNEAVKVIRR